MDTIFISQLHIETLIGVYPEERLAPQRLLLDLECTLDTQAASISDQVADTLDYAELTQKIQAWSSAASFCLVEALGDYLAKKILHTYTQIQTLSLKLEKFPAGLLVGSVGVKLVRQRV